MNKYNEIMERLTVSDEMREKLIAGVGKADKRKIGMIRASTLKRVAAIAACLVLLLAGAIVLKNLSKNEVPVTAGGYSTGGPDDMPVAPLQYNSASELSEASGIFIEDLENVPFVPTETVYQYYDNGIAEIVYSDGEEVLSYRVSYGDEDNSGDCNEYAEVFQKEIDGAVYTLKGDGELIYCALYRRGDSSCSITSTVGLTVEQIGKMR